MFTLKLSSTSHTSGNFDHGRIEKRTATMLTDLSMMSQKEEWKNVSSVLKIDTERYIKLSQETTAETRYYICSTMAYSAAQMNSFIRNHWGIENKLHWHLDVNFGEDASRKRVGNAARNFNLILKTALAVLLRDKENKISINRKKQKASYSYDYREKLMKV